MKQSPGPAACTAGPAKLHGAAQPSVAAGPFDQGLVLGRAGGAGLQADCQQFAQGFRQIRIVDSAFQRGLLHVGQAHAVGRQDVGQHGIALGGGLHVAIGQRLGARSQGFLFALHGGNGGLGQVKIDGHASVVDALVQVPQIQFRPLVVPLGQLGRDGAHGQDVAARIGHEPGPLFGVGLAGGAAQGAVGRARLAEQVDQLPAVFVFGLVGVDLQHVAQCAQRAGHAVGQGAYHRVTPAFGTGETPAPRFIEIKACWAAQSALCPALYKHLAQYCPVEMTVVRHQRHRLVAQQVVQCLRHAVLGAVPHADRAVVHRPGEQHDLGFFGVSVRAVGNRHFGKRF